MPERRQAAGGTLIVGGGFAGAYVARLLGRHGATIVNPDNFMLYTPLLPEAAAATLEPRHVVVPLRQMCPHAELLLGQVTSRDPAGRTVVAETLGGTFEIAYERLVVALGAVPRTFPVPGLAEHGRGFKDVADAIALRNHLLRSLESAAARLDRTEAERDLGFVFVGAGYAGVEALAELNDLAHAAVRRSYPMLRDVRQRWVLVDAAPSILAEIPPNLGEYTHRYLETKRGIRRRRRCAGDGPGVAERERAAFQSHVTGRERGAAERSAGGCGDGDSREAAANPRRHRLVADEELIAARHGSPRGARASRACPARSDVDAPGRVHLRRAVGTSAPSR